MGAWDGRVIWTGLSQSPFRWVNPFFVELLEAKFSPSVFSLMESHAYRGLAIPSVPGRSQLRLLVFLLLYIHSQKCQRCPICRVDVMLGLLRSWDPLKDTRGSSPCCHLGSRLVEDHPLQPPQALACLHTRVFTSLCCSPRKFKTRVKFIVSISFILSIVLHFIICCDILNGACHSILTTAKGYSHLLCQAFQQP